MNPRALRPAICVSCMVLLPVLLAQQPLQSASYRKQEPAPESRSSIPTPLAEDVRTTAEGLKTGASQADPQDPSMTLSHLPAQAHFQHHVTVLGTKDSDSAKALVPNNGKLIYSDTHGRFILGPNAGVRVADDITTTGANGCGLERFVFRVTGDRDNNPSIDEGPFSVHYALYETCPGATICQAGDSFCPEPIGGTSGLITLPDEGFHEIEIVIPDAVCAGGLNDGKACFTNDDCLPTCDGGDRDGLLCTTVLDCPGGGTCPRDLVGSCEVQVSLPSSFYFAVTFSRQKCGIVVGAPPLVGISADRYDAGSFACTSGFGGFPAHPHASFDLEVYARDDCPSVFPRFHNTMQAGQPYSAGSQKYFADDITLGVDAQDCNLIGYEVRVRGTRSNSQGGKRVDLYSEIDPDDWTSFQIPGTRAEMQVFGNDVQILRKTLSMPIPLADYLDPTGRLLWVGFRSSSSEVGPIQTDRTPIVGNTVRSGISTNAGPTSPLCNDLALDMTLYCAGDAPTGACCDSILEEDYACVGGSHPGRPCATDADCFCEPACENGVCHNFACVGGPNPGAPCFTDSECPCPSNTCPSSTCSQSTHRCVGGPRNNSFCNSNSDCLDQICDGGPMDGQPCTTESDCDFPAPCTNDGYCIGDAVCREVPEWNCPSSDPGNWAKGGHCGPVCVGGSKDRTACATDADCPSVCINGDTDNGTPCTANIDCQGQCNIGTCEGSFCNGGVNDALPCTREADCPGGYCEDQLFGGGLACGAGACCVPDQFSGCLTVSERECLEASSDHRLSFHKGLTCEAAQCPWWYCYYAVCHIIHIPICNGGSYDGEPCDPEGLLEYECPPGSPFTTCEVSFDCVDFQCCNDICNLDPSCCIYGFDETCTEIAHDVCRYLPKNDRCYYPERPDGGATLATLPYYETEVDLEHSRTLPNEPGFCCLDSDPGGQGVATAWYKFVAESPDPEASTISVAIDTCDSAGPYITFPSDDSVIQVFRVAGSDKGTCDDSSECSVTAQDCIDGSTCAVRDETACTELIPIACSDSDQIGCDGSSPSTQPDQASLCVDNLIVGHTYYIAVAAEPPTEKRCFGGADAGALCISQNDCDGRCSLGENWGQRCTSSDECPNGYCMQGECKDYEHRGFYKLRIQSPCGRASAPIPNDLCDNAELLTGTEISTPFDLSGGGVNDPATFDCPGSLCLPSLENDIWYDWIAPANGAVEVNTCAGFGQLTPDTAMAVYDGCECPIDEGTVLGCSDLEFSADCAGGSRVRFNTEKDHCYKIRLGGRLGVTNVAGNLNLRLNPCPSDPVTFDDPPNGTVDARQPHASENPDKKIGIQRITITAPPGIDLTDRPGSKARFSCWDFCEANVDDSGLNNQITNFVDNQDGTFTLELLRPITPGAVTKITYKAGDGTLMSAVYTSHPGNVDAGPMADVGDITALMDYLSGMDVPPWGTYSTDIDHSGATTPTDLLSLIDLLEGGGAFAGWRSTFLPSPVPCEP